MTDTAGPATAGAPDASPARPISSTQDILRTAPRPTTVQPLAGFTVAITSDGRRDELVGLLTQDGARIVTAPALRPVPAAEEARLRSLTRAALERPPDAVVVTTDLGMQDWLDVADGWGLGDALRARLSASLVVSAARKGTVQFPAPTQTAVSSAPQDRAAGTPRGGASDRLADVLEHLLARQPEGGPGRRGWAVRGPLAGRRIAVQLHGERRPDVCAALAAAGAEVTEIPIHRWAPPSDPTQLRRLVDLVANNLVDAVTFTSARAVASVLRVAGPQAEAVLVAMRTCVLASCLGPQAADALRRHGVLALAPPPGRAGRAGRAAALARTLAGELPRRARTLRVAGAELVLRGHAAVVDGVLTPLPPAQMAILRALAAAPGKVLARSELLESLPRGADEHAVEMAVARLRAALGRSAFIQTVVKRGYRLRVD